MQIFRSAVSLSVCVGLLILSSSSLALAAAPTSGKLLRNGTGLYPRVIQLAHSGGANGALVASVVDADSNTGVIYRSTDQGNTFTEVGHVHDPAAPQGLCCSALFELPTPIGAMPAGTLLWAASIGQSPTNRRMSLDVWKSQDQGSTWTSLSDCQTSSNNGGLWEPELYIDSSNELVCQYSDETNPQKHSQSLQERFSSDGINWSNPHPVVALNKVALRPGMSVVTQLLDGSYYMTYEVCGTSDQYDCAAHFRTSADGKDWGNASDIGPKITASDGEYFTHTPFVISSNSRLFLIGQQLRKANGTIAPGSGRTIMTNAQDGQGTWHVNEAPIAVPSPDNNFCPNYSSPLLPLPSDNNQLLEIATAWDGPICKPYYATESLQETKA